MCRATLQMPMVLSKAPLHSVGDNDQNEMKHDFFSHVMPLVPTLPSCDVNCIINDILFRELKQGNT